MQEGKQAPDLLGQGVVQRQARGRGVVVNVVISCARNEGKEALHLAGLGAFPRQAWGNRTKHALKRGMRKEARQNALHPTG